MNQLPQKLRLLQRFTATLLLVAMIYQLGACPCGCLEHNAWAHLLGLDAESRDDASVGSFESPGHSSVNLADTHDCTGEPRTQFVDNARGPRVEGSTAFSSLLPALDCCLAVSDSQTGFGQRRGGPPAGLAGSVALYRPALQVYRL